MSIVRSGLMLCVQRSMISGRVWRKGLSSKWTGSGSRRELIGATIPEIGDFELARTSTITIAADLPEGDAPVRFGWAALYGDLVVRQAGGGEDAYTAFLSDGDLSEPLSRIEIRTEGRGGRVPALHPCWV